MLLLEDPMTRATFVAAAALALANWTTPVAAQDAGIGEELYMQYCATCHGTDGAGGGPLTDILSTPVADLTGLAARNDGEFPMLEVIHIIDGRTGLRGHGGPMPTYGDVFTAEVGGDMGPYGSVLETRGRILSLALYLESLQP